MQLYNPENNTLISPSSVETVNQTELRLVRYKTTKIFALALCITADGKCTTSWQQRVH